MTPAEIRAIRKTLGLTQAQLAAVMGLRGPQTVSEWQTGRRIPDGSNERLLRAYAEGYRPVDWPGQEAGETMKIVTENPRFFAEGPEPDEQLRRLFSPWGELKGAGILTDDTIIVQFTDGRALRFTPSIISQTVD